MLYNNLNEFDTELKSIKLLDNKTLKEELANYNEFISIDTIGVYDRLELEIILAQYRVRKKNQIKSDIKAQYDLKISEARKIDMEKEFIRENLSYLDIIEQLRRRKIPFDPLAEKETLVTLLALARLAAESDDGDSEEAVTASSTGPAQRMGGEQGEDNLVTNLLDVQPELERLRQRRLRYLQAKAAAALAGEIVSETVQPDNASEGFSTGAGLEDFMRSVDLTDTGGELEEEEVDEEAWIGGPAEKESNFALRNTSGSKSSGSNISSSGGGSSPRRRVELDSWQFLQELLQKSPLRPAADLVQGTLQRAVHLLDLRALLALAHWVRACVLGLLRPLALWAGGDPASGSLILFYSSAVCVLGRKGPVFFVLCFLLARTLRQGLASLLAAPAPAPQVPTSDKVVQSA